MSVDLIKVINNLLVCTFVGFAILCVFDTISLLTEHITHHSKKALSGIKDFVFTVTYATVVIILVYYCSEGIFRGIYFFATLIGSYINYYLFRSLFRRVLKLILLPIFTVLRLLGKIIIKMKEFLFHTIEKIEIKLYNRNRNCEL